MSVTPGARPPYECERRLIAWSAGTAVHRERHRAAAETLAVGADWGELARALVARGLLATLGGRIVPLGGGAGSQALADAVEQAVAAGRRRGALLELHAARLLGALAAAGIRCAALKGPCLARAIYADPGRRLSRDIDLLVDPAELHEAARLVGELGYGRLRDEQLDRAGLPALHLVLAHESGELPPVEVHWRIHWYERRFAAERLLPTAAEQSLDWRPAPADELAALLLYYARDGFAGLRLAADIAAWWDANGRGLPDGALDDLVGAYPALARVIGASVAAAAQTVGLPASELGHERCRLGRRQRLAVALADPHPGGSEAQLYAEMGLIDGLLAPRGGLPAFARRQLLPPRSALASQAREAGRRRPRSRIARAVGTLGRYCLVLVALARTRAVRGSAPVLGEATASGWR